MLPRGISWQPQVRFEGGPQRVRGVVEPRLDGPEGHAELGGNLGERQAEVVVEDEDRALLQRQPPESALHRVTLEDGAVVVASRRLIGWEQSNVGRPVATALGLSVACVDEEAPQPGVEAIDIPELRQLPPGEDERLLDGVFREPEIAQDPIRNREESIASGARQAGKGVLISGSRSLDEGNLHPRLPSAMRPTWTPTVDEPGQAQMVRSSRGAGPRSESR